MASNYFYKFLKSLDFTSDDINLIISGADNADDLPAIALKIASNKATSEKIKNVFNEFPRSKDDFYKLKSLLKGG